MAKWSGAKPEDVPGGIALYAFPTACRSRRRSGWAAARTASPRRRSRRPRQFQLSQKQIEKTLPDYSVAVNPSYAADAAK